MKAGISKSKATEIADLLNLDQKRKKIFIELAESQFSRNELQRSLALKKLKQLESKYRASQRIENDFFNLISDWWHFAILELCYVRSFRSDPKWIARQLDLEIQQIEEALQRLLKFKLLKIEKGQLCPTEDYSLVSGEIPSAGIRKFHKEIIKRATQSIEQQNLDERCLRSSFLAIRKDKIKEAFAAIAKFHEDFCEEIGENSKFNFEKDDVYALSTQFFKITSHRKEPND